MSNKITDEQLRQTPFGRFVNIQEDTADETDNIDADIPSYEPNVTVNTDIQEDDIIAQEEKPKGSFLVKDQNAKRYSPSLSRRYSRYGRDRQLLLI